MCILYIYIYVCMYLFDKCIVESQVTHAIYGNYGHYITCKQLQPYMPLWVEYTSISLSVHSVIGHAEHSTYMIMEYNIMEFKSIPTDL